VSLSTVLITTVLSAALVATPALVPATAYAAECLPPSCSVEPTKYTGTPPTLVYRVETRPPAEIFSTGFVSRGDNLDLVQHVLRTPDSGFVATTDSPEAVARIAQALVKMDNTKPLWVYTIRASDNFYHVSESLDWIVDHNPAHRAKAENALARYSHQKEWAAVKRIPPSQIQQAVRVIPSITPERDFRLQIAPHDPANPSVAVNTSGYSHHETRGSEQLFTDNLAKELAAGEPPQRSSGATTETEAPPSAETTPAKLTAREVRLQPVHLDRKIVFSGRARLSERYSWLASATEELSDAEVDQYLSLVTESIDLIREKPEGARLIDALDNLNYKPLLDGNKEASLSQFVNAADRSVSPVKVIFLPNKAGKNSFISLSDSAAGDGSGSVGFLHFDAEAYTPSREVKGQLFLQRPAEVLTHELVHAIHSLGGATAPDLDVMYNAIMNDVNTPSETEPPRYIGSKQTIPVEEAITHGRKVVLTKVNTKYPVPEGYTVPEGIAIPNGITPNQFESKADSVANSLTHVGPQVSQELREAAVHIRHARINAWNLSETRIVSEMTINSQPTPVRAYYKDFDKDSQNPKMYGSGKPLAYRIPGSQRNVSLEYRTSPDSWETPPSASGKPPQKVPVSLDECGASSHFLACKPKTADTAITDAERAAAVEEYYLENPSARPAAHGPGTKKVRPHELDVLKVQEDAQKLQEEILADREFVKGLPARSPQQMSATDIEITHTALKAKISALRSGAIRVTATAGIGVGLYQAIETYTNTNATPMDKLEATTSLIPVVSNMMGLAEGIESGNAETIAVNTIALASLLVAQAVPAVGELIDVGLFTYITVKAITMWWQSLDPEETRVARGCALDTAQETRNPIVAIYDAIWAIIHKRPPCVPADFMAQKSSKAQLRAEHEARRPRPINSCRADSQLADGCVTVPWAGIVIGLPNVERLVSTSDGLTRFQNRDGSHTVVEVRDAVMSVTFSVDVATAATRFDYSLHYPVGFRFDNTTPGRFNRGVIVRNAAGETIGEFVRPTVYDMQSAKKVPASLSVNESILTVAVGHDSVATRYPLGGVFFLRSPAILNGAVR